MPSNASVKTHDNVCNNEDPWAWSAVESKTDQLKTDETITNLKKRIEELQNENRDLITSLDQLDQNHQQNTEQLVKMKNKLNEELEIVTEKYEILNMKYNKLALAENGYKKKINELKNKCEELKQHKERDLLDKGSNTSEKYKIIEKENIELKERIVVLEKIKNSANSESDLGSIQELQLENKALKIALQTTSELKSKIEEYEKEIALLKNELKVYAEKTAIKAQESASDNDDENGNNKDKIISDQEDCFHLVYKDGPENEWVKDKDEVVKKYEEKIAEILDEMEKLKNDKDVTISLHMDKLKLKETEVSEIIQELDGLKKNNEDLEKNYIELQEINRVLKKLNGENEDAMEEYRKQISLLEDELSSIRKENEERKRRSDNYERKISQQYLHIIKENFEEYLEEEEIAQDDLESLVKSISNHVNLRVEELQNKLEEINRIKSNLQMAKDEEIENLSHKSKILEQELSRRSKELRDAEDECTELMKNNEILIGKLEDLKENGLQTIFESNEDNVALLEKQLEMSSKRIEELEALLADKNQRVKIENKIIETEQDDKYCELLSTIEDLTNKLQSAETERDNCRALIDKMRLDYETTEYQFSEMNINLETLSEEIEKHKMRIDLLVSENENLKSLKESSSLSNEELGRMKQELSLSKGMNEKLEMNKKDMQREYEMDKCRLEKEHTALRDEQEEMSLLKLHKEKEVEECTKIIESLKQEIEKMNLENEVFKKVFFSLHEALLLSNEETNPSEVDISINDLIYNVKERIDAMMLERTDLKSELDTLKNKMLDVGDADVQKEIQSLMASRNELIAIVQTKHQETLTYHAEIQRLSEILKHETERNLQMEKEIETMKHEYCTAESLKDKEQEIEKLNDQIGFLRQKCDVLAQSMLDEQQRVENEKTASLEKESALSKKLERLQSHLMEVEEHYTQELLQSEQKIASLQARLNEVERREKDSSNIYTSVSIRANQQNEALTQQLQSMTNQRDEFRKKMLDLEDENNIKAAALTNLQLVLEQFQRDKDADVVRETERIRRQVKQEQKIQEDLRKEIATLENQIKESKEGLRAALRLTDQLEISKNQVVTLKEEVAVLTEKLRSKEEELKTVASQTDGKIDKSLIKNLVIGFITSNKNLNKDQKQILKIIATVLDFNEQDHNKVNLNQAQQHTWLNSLLSPMAGDQPPSESLSRAFVNFLENESKPRVIPSLLPQGGISEGSSTSASSARSTPTPIVLNEIVLPTFSDFPQQRNSSSILKGVLKDNP